MNRPPVVRQNDVDEVLADVVYVTLDGGEHDGALGLAFHAVQMRLEVTDRTFHHFGGLEHEGKLHLTTSEQFTDGLHAIEQVFIDDLERWNGLHRLIETITESFLLSIDDVPSKPFGKGSLHHFLGDHHLGGLLEEFDEHGERIMIVGTTVVDEIERGGDLLLGDPSKRHDSSGVDDGAGEPRLHQFIEEDRVQNLSSRRLETEGAVRKAAGDLAFGHGARDLANGIDEFESASSVTVHSGRDRKHQRVEHHVRRSHAMHLDGTLQTTTCDLDFPFAGPSHRGVLVFVDRSDDDAGSVATGHSTDQIELLVAILEVGTVDDALSGCTFEPRLERLPLRGIKHQRRVDAADDPLHDLFHVRDVVASGVIDVDVEDVRSTATLVASKRDDGIPVLGFEQLAELLASGGVHALTDDQKGILLPVVDVAVAARTAGNGSDLPRLGWQVLRFDLIEQRSQFSDVIGGGATTSSKDGDA